MISDLRHFVGVPFRDGGRDLAAADCWGLVRAFLAEMGVCELPDYGETPASDVLAIARAVDAATASPLWRPVPVGTEQAGDVVVLSRRPQASRPNGARRLSGHVGVFVGARRILHVEEATASVIVRRDHPSIRHRIAGVWRHRELAS